MIPEEIYSEQNQLGDDGTLAKVLFYDIVTQTRLPAGISAVDADNCYDQIAHLTMSLVFQALRVPQEAVVSMLSTIQDMNFFLHTGFGDSNVYAGSTDSKKTQGLCQGNGAAPAGWTVTSMAMINVHKRKGHGVHLTSPITKAAIHLVETLFVDDTDLKHFDMNKVETITAVHKALQQSIHKWGLLLIVTGGALKPGKCFCHLILFSLNPDGTWRYETNKQLSDLGIMVPLEDGTLATIEHLCVTAPT